MKLSELRLELKTFKRVAAEFCSVDVGFYWTFFVIVMRLLYFFSFFFQTCSQVLQALQRGDFGDKGRNSVDDFKAACHKRLPYAIDFFSGQQHNNAAAASYNHDNVESLTNHVSTLSVEDGTNLKNVEPMEEDRERACPV